MATINNDRSKERIKSVDLYAGDKITFEYASTHYDGTVLERNILEQGSIEFVINIGPMKTYEIQTINSKEDGLNYRITHISSDSRVATCYLKENAELVCDALNKLNSNNKLLRVKANNIRVIRKYTL